MEMQENNIEEQIQILENQRLEINNSIEDLKTKQLEKQLPSYKKKYEGKYFKYQNSYSDGTKWFLYVYCKEAKIEDGNIFFINNIFQIFSDNKIEFTYNRIDYGHSFQKQITKKEYDRALLKVLRQLQKSGFIEEVTE